VISVKKKQVVRKKEIRRAQKGRTMEQQPIICGRNIGKKTPLKNGGGLGGGGKTNYVDYVGKGGERNLANREKEGGSRAVQKNGPRKLYVDVKIEKKKRRPPNRL